MGILSRLPMQSRITLSVALGLSVILVIFAWLAVSAVHDTRDAAKEERLTWARATAIHVDDVLTRSLGRLDLLARMTSETLQQGEEAAAAALSGISPEFMFGADLHLVDPNGRLIWSNQRGDIRPRDVLAEATAARALATGQPQIGECSAGQGGMTRICLASPVIGQAGQEEALLLASLDPHSPELNLAPSPQLGEGAHVEVLNGDGIILAADRQDLTGTSVHAPAVAEFMATRTAGVRIHDPGQAGEEHIAAYAPLETLPGWGVVVEQDADVALAVAKDLQQRMLLFGVLALILAVGLAWFDVRQVVKPLRLLTARAKRMAAGDLTTPISSSRRDEVGTLANAFESMRIRLQESLQEIERRDRELEQRVEERTREVQRLYEELQRKEELRGRLLDKVITAQEEERKRIARELHDETGQALTGIIMGLEAAEEALARQPEVARQRLERAKALASRGIEAIRQLIVDLRPAALDDLGLVPALRTFAETRLGEKGIRLEMETSGLKERLPPLVEISLLRVAQEAVTNIIRHSEARSARIQLSRSDGSVSLLVEDDGKGFDLAEVMNSPDRNRALGLLGMEERISLIGGHFSLESAPGQGTRVRAVIPLKEEGREGEP